MSRPICRLLLEASGLSAWHHAAGHLSCLARFPADTDGIARFAEFLTVDRRQRYILVTNLAEESHVSETVPALSRRERQALLERRRARLFPDSPWHASLPAGPRQATHLGLPQPARLMPWLAQLQATKSHLCAVNTLSQLISAWLRRAMRHTGPALIASQHGPALRLTATGPGGQLLASQLLDATLPSDEALTRFRQRPEVRSAIPDGQPVHLIGDAAFGRACPGQFTPTAEGDASHLLLALPENHWPRIQLAPPAWLATAREARLAGRLQLGGGLALALGMTACAAIATPHATINRQTREIEARLVDVRARQAVLADEIRRLPFPAEQLRRLADNLPRLDTAARRFPRAMLALSRALEANPAIRLDEIGWEIAAKAPSTGEAAELRLVLSLPEAVSEYDLRAPASLLEHLSSDFTAGPVQRVPDTPTSYRVQLHARHP